MENSKLGSSSIANIFSIFAFVFSILSFVYTCNESKQKDKEIVDITSKKVFLNEGVKLTKDFPELILHSFWETILTNNSEKTVSIKEYDIKCLKNKTGIMSYSGLNQGIYDEQLNPLLLPINIAPGESKRIYSKVGVMISKYATELILKEFDENKSYSFDDIKNRLARDSTDIFGNKLIVRFEGEKMVYFTFADRDYNKDVFGISFTSGRNNKYVDILKWYPEIEDFK